MKTKMLPALLVAALLIAAAAGGAGGSALAQGEKAAAPAEVAAGGETVRSEAQPKQAAESPDLSGWKLVAENGRLTLHVSPDTAEIAVSDTGTGAVWLSNPADREHDKLAKGAKKMELSSQLLIDYVDGLNKPFQANSFTGSVKEGKPELKQVEGGVEIAFGFPKAGFVIPVRYTLGEDYLSAAIVTEGIRQTGKFNLVNISLLPFFGAGGPEEEGFMLVPDGSGALIRFNNGKSSYRSYNERVYGGDAALDLPAAVENKETARLPVFGINKGNRGLLAVMASGEYQAGITAEVSGKNNSYNNVFGYLNLMESETNVLLEGTPNEKQVTRTSDSMTGEEPFEVRYYLLSGEEQSTYAGMAGRYRTYLQEELGVKAWEQPADSEEESLPLLIDFVGGAKKRETFLGFPYETVETLTSFKDVSNIASELIGEGITGLSVRMTGWSPGGAMDEVPVSLSAERKLGGTKGLLKLSRELTDKGVAFYPAADPTRMYEGGNGFSKFSDTAKGISRAPALKFQYRLSDGTKDKSSARWYLMKPDSAAEAAVRLAASAERNELGGIALQGIGSAVYSDFKRGGLSKNETGRIWEEALRGASEKAGPILFDHPNAYAFPYASALTDVPLYASGFDVTDEEVPFYRIATSGLLPAYSEPVNLSSMPRDYMLKLIETGTYPAYRFIAREASLLTGTEFDDLYSAEYGLWSEELLEQHRELSAAMKEFRGSAITGHRKLAEGVYETNFENGITAFVNYNDKNAVAGGFDIPANGYLIR
ncbi:DUF5696 domain-containing protein [Paenibacillus sp. LHD-117]|uniref:DUF5696 domain-containing protein n=1 Tax=Paenibacillus sp. LHD-117 TaxID=3071412 RepID=UPI0027DEF4D7|nr:DUF5696 domain-containing protein [Paenibacillus sp. LHD-117]MDQ6420297.1 DUF5696 domain-containing protein [Paenibacillus sp. LHD-117]